jgi:predicted ArsR family transcriptional regulator
LSYLIAQFEADNEREIRIQGSPIRVGGYTALDVSGVFKVTQKKAQKLLDSLVEKGAARVSQTVEWSSERRVGVAGGGTGNFHSRKMVTTRHKTNYYRAL